MYAAYSHLSQHTLHLIPPTRFYTSTSLRPKLRSGLRNNEGVDGTHGILLGTLEPTLVPDLELENVEVAIAANSALHKLVAATLITISTADKQIIHVVVLSLLVLTLAHIEQGSSSVAAFSEATL